MLQIGEARAPAPTATHRRLGLELWLLPPTVGLSPGSLLIFLRDLAFSHITGHLNCRTQLSARFFVPIQLFQGRRLLLRGLDTLQVPPGAGRGLGAYGPFLPGRRQVENPSLCPPASSVTFSSSIWASGERASPGQGRRDPGWPRLACRLGHNPCPLGAWSPHLYAMDFCRKELKGMGASCCFFHCLVGKKVNRFQARGRAQQMESKALDSCPGLACCPFSAGCPQSRISQAPPHLVLAKWSWHGDLGFNLLTPETSVDTARTAQGCAEVPPSSPPASSLFQLKPSSSSLLLWLLECKLHSKALARHHTQTLTQQHLQTLCPEPP
ncbi:unnamed protein product [Nyctereutes procyonoides]|uniref:(raccoon dog) hypothetical protein n=1 Tax=Nyctereutes procyonoides TaxID=34880 RepID=A0A811YZP0_NYCPR|nr:unnamed protein product [Nyctereutes procyonoides]